MSPREIRDEGNPGREPISGTLGGPCTGTVTATLTFGGIASGDVAFAGMPGSETVLHEHKRTGVILDDRPQEPSATKAQAQSLTTGRECLTARAFSFAESRRSPLRKHRHHLRPPPSSGWARVIVCRNELPSTIASG